MKLYQKKKSDSNNTFGSKAKGGKPLCFTPISCSIVPFVCFLHLCSVLVPFVHYYFQLKVLIRFFIVGGSLVLHPRRTESREGEEERDEERRTKEIREYRE